MCKNRWSSTLTTIAGNLVQTLMVPREWLQCLNNNLLQTLSLWTLVILWLFNYQVKIKIFPKLWFIYVTVRICFTWALQPYRVASVAVNSLVFLYKEIRTLLLPVLLCSGTAQPSEHVSHDTHTLTMGCRHVIVLQEKLEQSVNKKVSYVKPWSYDYIHTHTQL